MFFYKLKKAIRENDLKILNEACPTHSIPFLKNKLKYIKAWKIKFENINEYISWTKCFIRYSKRILCFFPGFFSHKYTSYNSLDIFVLFSPRPIYIVTPCKKNMFFFNLPMVKCFQKVCALFQLYFAIIGEWFSDTYLLNTLRLNILKLNAVG